MIKQWGLQSKPRNLVLIACYCPSSVDQTHKMRPSPCKSSITSEDLFSTKGTIHQQSMHDHKTTQQHSNTLKAYSSITDSSLYQCPPTPDIHKSISTREASQTRPPPTSHVSLQTPSYTLSRPLIPMHLPTPHIPTYPPKITKTLTLWNKARMVYMRTEWTL